MIAALRRTASDCALPRPYAPDDLERVLDFVGRGAAAADFCGWLHPGDVIHSMSERLLGRDLERHFHICEIAGAIAALVMFYPLQWQSYDLMIDPARRTPELEANLIAWSEATLWSLAQAANRTATSTTPSIETDVTDVDQARREALLMAGYHAPDKAWVMLSECSLLTPIPEPALTEGFTLRGADERDAALLNAAHDGAFGSGWTTDEYVRLMRTPGFDSDRLLIAAAPDGRCAALLVYWNDPISQVGLFEPVGCHPDFQRRGLTRGLMFEGLRRMQAAGMTRAIVKYSATNLPAAALYRSAGFTPKYGIMDFRKRLTSPADDLSRSGQSVSRPDDTQ